MTNLLAGMVKRGTLALLIVIALASPALAGPPLLCFPFDIGNARSLPWAADTGWKGLRSDYDIRALADDTTALLTSSTPILVRMETLRRAALYATRDPQVAKVLLERLDRRARDAAGNGRVRALALFDAGYLVEAYKQAAPISAATAAVAGSSDGYAMVRQSLTLSGNDPAIEFAAALMTSDHDTTGRYAEHVRLAREGSSQDQLLARNITHLSH